MFRMPGIAVLGSQHDSDPRAASALTVLRCGAPALLLAVAVLLPYLSKAFTIDDPLFLRSAEQVLRDPLHPTAFSIVWDEDKIGRAHV